MQKCLLLILKHYQILLYLKFALQIVMLVNNPPNVTPKNNQMPISFACGGVISCLLNINAYQCDWTSTATFFAQIKVIHYL